jgi:hypothetical protein
MFCNNHKLEMGGGCSTTTQERDEKGIKILVEEPDKRRPLGIIRCSTSPVDRLADVWTRPEKRI